MTEIFTKYVYLTLLSIDLLLKFNLKIRWYWKQETASDTEEGIWGM